VPAPPVAARGLLRLVQPLPLRLPVELVPRSIADALGARCEPQPGQQLGQQLERPVPVPVSALVLALVLSAVQPLRGPSAVMEQR